MNLTYIPLLQIQRDLHDIPRGMERFREYLRTTLTAEGDDVELAPLLLMNPMGREHVAALLDTLLALDADAIAAQAAAEASAQTSDVGGEYRAALVIADDLMGGGTNRFAYEFELRFGPESLRNRTAPQSAGRHWITAVVWSSEAATEKAVREAMLTAIYRHAFIQRHGRATTLRERMVQEGVVMARAGCTTPVLEADDLAYTREVIAPHLEATDMRTAIECLFGDAAARSLGFTARGFSSWAGLAVALHDAR